MKNFDPRIDLAQLQANILKHHGRTFAYHLFLKIHGNSPNEAKRGLADLSAKITSAKLQLEHSAERALNKYFDGGPVITLSLSNTGYGKLGLTPPTDAAFIAGMKSRNAELNDDTSKWEPEFKENIDLLIIVADSNETKAIQTKNRILHSIKGFTSLIKEQRGEVLRNQHGLGLEHFGYVDGVSQPVYLPSEIAAQSDRDHWDDTGILENLFVFQDGDTTKQAIGSFFVFRKLEQDVKAFKAREEGFASTVRNQAGTLDPELTGAMVVGRFEDGTEVVNHSEEQRITMERQLNNDFLYNDQSSASKCPFHAHIRITNPRDDASIPFSKSVRLTRRGIPYNDIGRNVKDLNDDQPTEGVGLLFMSYQNDIARQFEFIQHTWANQGNIGGNLVGIDGIIGQGTNTTNKFLPDQWGDGNPNNNTIDFEGFVKMLGGEYFFTPRIDFLKSLATNA
jgi:Dyp-type peroxidase family